MKANFTKKGALTVTLALAAGAVIGNIDRLPLPTNNDTEHRESLVAENNDIRWRNQDYIQAQAHFVDGVHQFSEAVRKSMPSRNLALKEHRAINETCGRPTPLHDYRDEFTYRDAAQRYARACLKVAEETAVTTRTKYDTAYAERAAEYARSDFPEKTNVPFPTLK